LTVFVGIDAGGTRATAVVIDEGGTMLARAAGGAGLITTADPSNGAAALAELAKRALDQANIAGPAAVLCCAVAGAGREQERRALEVELQRVAPATLVIVRADAEAALFDGLNDDAGILLIAGTGSIAWGRSADGRIERVGGWGQLLGDEGSGYAIGLAALRAAVRMHDGRGVSTSLVARIVAVTGLTALSDLIRWTDGASKGAIAALAPVVFDAARQGDVAAAEIAAVAAHELADQVEALYRRLAPWPEPPRIALAGGLLSPGGPLRELVTLAIRDRIPSAVVLEKAVDGARGAAELARASAPTTTG
jgi:glucosamine kinase